VFIEHPTGGMTRLLLQLQLLDGADEGRERGWRSGRHSDATAARVARHAHGLGRRAVHALMDE